MHFFDSGVTCGTSLTWLWTNSIATAGTVYQHTTSRSVYISIAVTMEIVENHVIDVSHVFVLSQLTLYRLRSWDSVLAFLNSLFDLHTYMCPSFTYSSPSSGITKSVVIFDAEQARHCPPPQRNALKRTVKGVCARTGVFRMRNTKWIVV
jgi:hypothetical protein